jgi:AraC-like DNA-binding protein
VTAAFKAIPATAEGVDRHLFRSDLVTVGEWRCPPHHPLFHDSGPIRDHCFTFPRTPALIQRTGRPMPVDPTVAELYDSGEEYRRHAVGGHAAECDYFVVAPHVLREAMRERDPAAAQAAIPRFPAETVKVDSSLYLRQRRLFRAVVAGAVTEPLSVEESVLGLLDAVLEAAYGGKAQASAAPRAGARRRAALADEARRQLAARLDEATSLARLARRLDCSPFHLCRAFREATGGSLHRYRMDMRLREALARLEAGADVGAVAHELGFSSHSHFTSAFRSSFGITPSAFARQR